MMNKDCRNCFDYGVLDQGGYGCRSNGECSKNYCFYDQKIKCPGKFGENCHIGCEIYEAIEALDFHSRMILGEENKHMNKGLVISIKVSKKNYQSLKDFISRVEAVIGEKLEPKEEYSKHTKAFQVKISLITRRATIIINQDFLEDVIKLYGNVFITSLMFAKTLSDFEDKFTQLEKKWFQPCREW